MENKNSGIQESKNSKNNGGQKILAVVVGVIIAAFAVIMIFAAADTHGGGSSEKESTAKKLEKADVVGYWYVPSENLEDSVEEYYEFTNDNTYRFYELTDGAVDLFESGSYTFADGTAATKANVQFFEKDSSGNNTISSGSVTGILECKSWTKNTIHFLEKSEDYDGSDKLTLKRLDTDEKIKEAENKRLDQIDQIDQQIDAKTGVVVY